MGRPPLVCSAAGWPRQEVAKPTGGGCLSWCLLVPPSPQKLATWGGGLWPRVLGLTHGAAGIRVFLPASGTLAPLGCGRCPGVSQKCPSTATSQEPLGMGPSPRQVLGTRMLASPLGTT